MSVLSEATRISTEHKEIFLAYLDLMSEQTEFLRPNMFNYNQLIVGITTEGDVLTVNDPFPNLDLPVYESFQKKEKKEKKLLLLWERLAENTDIPMRIMRKYTQPQAVTATTLTS